MPDVTFPETVARAAVFPEMIQMEARIVLAGTVADPLAARVNLRHVGMPALVGETTTVGGFRRGTRGRSIPYWRRTARRDLAPDFTISAAARLARSLRLFARTRAQESTL
jgi:hypothetical protein